MRVADKAQDITREDLLDLGSEFDVNQPRGLLEKVLDTV